MLESVLHVVHTQMCHKMHSEISFDCSWFCLLTQAIVLILVAFKYLYISKFFLDPLLGTIQITAIIEHILVYFIANIIYIIFVRIHSIYLCASSYSYSLAYLYDVLEKIATSNCLHLLNLNHILCTRTDADFSYSFYCHLSHTKVMYQASLIIVILKFTINNAHYLKFGYIIWKFILQSHFILYLQSFQVIIIIIKNINLFNSSLILVTKK